MPMGVLVGLADFLVGLMKVPAPFLLESTSYIGQHCADDEGFIMADAVHLHPVDGGMELLHVSGDFLLPINLEGDDRDDQVEDVLFQWADGAIMDGLSYIREEEFINTLVAGVSVT